MKEIGAFEAKTRLGQLLDQVEAGEDILITRRGKPVARLSAPGSTYDRERALAAVARIKARRKGLTLDGLKIEDLIDEGRR